MNVRPSPPPRSARPQAPQYDDFGFLIGHHLTPTLGFDMNSGEDDYIRMWREFINYDWPLQKTATLVKMIESGVPHQFRGTVWKRLAKMGSHRKPEHYPETYFEVLSAVGDKTKASQQIELDLTRTFPNHRMFLGDNSYRSLLKRVLVAYSLHNHAVGYCQGMSNCAAVLLMFFPDAEDVFWLFVSIIDYKLDHHFEPGLRGMTDDAAIFVKLFQKTMPKLYKHLEAAGIEPLMYLTPWWLQLFTNLPLWSATLYLWDLYFLHGTTALFIGSLSILYTCQNLLLQAVGMQEIIPILLSPPLHCIEPKCLAAAAADLHVYKLVKQYRSNRSREQEATVRSEALTRLMKKDAQDMKRGRPALLPPIVTKYKTLRSVFKRDSEEERQKLERRDTHVALEEFLEKRLLHLPGLQMSRPRRTTDIV
ncbi:RabGAP/TBC domain-containing protein [Planoprotostelium fungivorum]|uniref:RabGAP/TBC domain-containing protein n=1 Tax=Planoprotostelium fungivorum TaxID=1890364 RepID=A0A2P6N1V3_9EUKA|nr:RabGAP/TBC domain-containing protein [Planoprotostelium fungivorum]